MKKLIYFASFFLILAIFFLFVFKQIQRQGTETIKDLMNQLDVVTHERLIEIREYFNEIRSTNGNELIVAQTTYFTELTLADTQREFWTSLFFDRGISLGTSTINVRCPTIHKYYIKISDPWIMNVKDGVIYIKQPVIRHLNPPAVKLDRLEIKSDRGWARGSTDEMQKEALTIFMNEAIKRGVNSIPKIREQANKGIIKFVKNWILNLKGIDLSEVSIEIVESFPEMDQDNIRIQIDAG